MTIRQLLQGLHKLACELGADTEVEITGPSLHLKVHEVRAGTVGPYPVALIQTRTRKIVARKPKCMATHLGYLKKSYRKAVAAGLCYRCKQPLGDSETLDCKECAAVRLVKDRHRKQAKRLADRRKTKTKH